MISQFADIFVQMVVLFAVGATGYAAKRLNLMDEDFDKKFSKLILNTALPALILASVLTAETLPSATKILWTAGVSCASYVVLVAIGFSITAALRVPDGRKGVFRFMMVFGNTGFIGFPVTAAVFGAEALIYTTVFNLAFNALVFTLGVWMLATDNKYGVKIKMSPKSFLSPCIVASVASIALAFAGIHGVPVLGEGWTPWVRSPPRRLCSSSARRWPTCRRASWWAGRASWRPRSCACWSRQRSYGCRCISS